jgi:hypothetical protein
MSTTNPNSFLGDKDCQEQEMLPLGNNSTALILITVRQRLIRLSFETGADLPSDTN